MNRTLKQTNGHDPLTVAAPGSIYGYGTKVLWRASDCWWRIKQPQLAMRILREALLCFLVVAVVLSLYFVAAGAALLSFCGFVSKRSEPEAVHHMKIVTDGSGTATG